ncbi:MAG: ABC-F family ATP-binding cassette domain-containing protein [Verrucomicrobiota bacterium]
MISLKNIRLQYGERFIFRDETATIGAKDRIGLVGSNGMGKTTLLRVLTGQEDLDSGEIVRAKHTTIGYLPQDGIHSSGRSLYDEVASVFEEVQNLTKWIEEASEELQSLDTNSEEYHETLERIGSWEVLLEDHDATKLPSKIKTILAGLGFEQGDFERDTGEFSGGWQMRIALAKLLLANPSLLLLDEPTNHLDISSQQWLENYLAKYEGSLLMVSHDRSFLDTLCTRIFEVTLGALNRYQGNYSKFEVQSAQQREHLRKAQANQQREIEKAEEFINRFRAKATKARQVQSRIKALDKVERIELEEEESAIAFSFPSSPRSGQTILEVKQLCKSYGDLAVLDKIDLKIERGDRIAVVGVNGAGKSTLVKVISGDEPYQSGEIAMGSQTVPTYFAQHQADTLDPELDALSIVEQVAPAGHNKNLRSVLGSFLFRGDDVFKKVKVLSGGERNRLALAKILVQPSNFLVLDEPTNHLDINSQNVLQNAIRDYDGSFIIVSHNRAFVDPIVNKTLEVRKDGISLFPGNVSDYLRHLEETQVAVEDPAKNGPTPHSRPVNSENPKEARRRRAELQKKLSPIKKKLAETEDKIATLEERQAVIEALLADPEYFKKPEAPDTMREYDLNKDKIDSAYTRWQELSDQISQLEESA